MHAATLAGEYDAAVEPERMTTANLLTVARDFLEAAGQHSRDVARELTALRGENARLRRAKAGSPDTTSGAPSDPPAIARELIGMADRLDHQRGNPALRWVDTSVARLLEQSEIYRIEDNGEVDPTRQEVIEVRRAGEGELVNHIAATVRPGYGWRGQILRPQEVVAYVTGDST